MSRDAKSVRVALQAVAELRGAYTRAGTDRDEVIALVLELAAELLRAALIEGGRR